MCWLMEGCESHLKLKGEAKAVHGRGIFGLNDVIEQHHMRTTTQSLPRRFAYECRCNEGAVWGAVVRCP